MRSSPVAPDQAFTDKKKSDAPTSASSPISGSHLSINNAKDNVSSRRYKTTQPQFLTTTNHLLGDSSFQSIPNQYGISTSNAQSSALSPSSNANKGDNSPRTAHSDSYSAMDTYDVRMPGNDKFDDISNASTDDPYTYSDDSASLSDAYFLQQPSLDVIIGNTQVGQFGPMPLSSSEGKERKPSSKNSPVWSGPPWIHVDKKMSQTTKVSKRDSRNSRSVSNRSSSKYADRDQRRQQRQWQQEQNASLLSSNIEGEEPMNESTSLLDKNRRFRNRQRDRELKKKNKLAKTKNSNRSIVKSNAHRQHRKKHQLRKFEQNLLLQVQQKRQEERERAVSEVRGQPQPISRRGNRFWAVLFALQLILVCTFAVKYGLTFYRPLPPLDQDLSSSLSPASNVSSSDKVYPALMSSMLVSSVGDNIAQPHGFDNADETEDVTLSKEEPFTIDYKNVLSLLVISGIYACIASYMCFAFMLILARSIIPIMLVFTVLLMICSGLFGLTVNERAGSFISFGGFIVFGMSFAYTASNWNQIPFCSTNLHTAICAMRSSIGILLVGISSLFVGLFWLLTWTIALMGTFNHHNFDDCQIWDECETHVYIFRSRMIELALLLVSLYWTTMVIKNIVRVVVAGAIGGPWWFGAVYDDAEDEFRGGRKQPFDKMCGCWNNSIVVDPLVRACSSSLGTICFGSLIGFPAYVLSIIVACLCWLTGSTDDGWNVRPSSENIHDTNEYAVGSKETITTDSTGVSEVDLLVSQNQLPSTAGTNIRILRKQLRRLDRILQSCNRWSYTYIGMYNYSYYEGGGKAIQLFETREWMDIARDTLIQNILIMTSIVIGVFTGMVAVLVEEVDGYTFTSLHKPILTSFLIGFFLGSILSYILLLGVAGSAVNTVLVCFAAEPFAFDRNHPHLSSEMREVWSQQVWEPDESGDRVMI